MVIQSFIYLNIPFNDGSYIVISIRLFIPTYQLPNVVTNQSWVIVFLVGSDIRMIKHTVEFTLRNRMLPCVVGSYIHT